MKRIIVATLLLLGSSLDCALAQSRFDRKAAEATIDLIYRDLRRCYYDSTFNGFDLVTHTEKTRGSFKNLKTEADMLVALSRYLKPLYIKCNQRV